MDIERSSALVLLLSSLALLGCEAKVDAPGSLVMSDADYEAWEIDLVEMRIEKNEGFMQSQESPLPEILREGFEGLDYYFRPTF